MRTVGLVLVLGWTAVGAHAQSVPDRYTLALRGVPVEEALETLVEVTQINLIYDPELLSDVRVFCAERDEAAESFLRCIVEAAGLDFYRLSSGTYVVIEAPRQAPQRGQLRGMVVDGDTGEPLPFAHIVLADASTGTAANASGAFLVPALLAGAHTVVASHVGYMPAIEEVWVPAAGQAEHRFVLKPEPVAAAPLVVDGLSRRLPSADLGRGVETPATAPVMGAFGGPDVGYQAGEVLGVTLQLPQADASIQGGEAGEHQLLLDGVPVWDPVSLGRLLGAFSPLAIGQLTVHKAGFGALHGSQTSGVIEARHALPETRTLQGRATVDPLSVNGRMDVPYRLAGAEGALMVAGRRSVWDVRPEPMLEDRLQAWNRVDPLLTAVLLGNGVTEEQTTLREHSSDLGFSDVHAATRLRFSPFHQTYASFYRGTNRVETDLLTTPLVMRLRGGQAAGRFDVFQMLARESYDWTNRLAQVRHEWLLGARSFISLRARSSWHTLRQQSGMGRVAGSEETDVNLETLWAGLAHSSDRNTMREDAVEAHLDISASARTYVTASVAGQRTSSHVRLDNPFFQPITYTSTAWRWVSAVNVRTHLSAAWTVESGLRATYVPDRSRVYTEPRLALRLDGSSGWAGNYAARLSAGVYRQFIYPFEMSSAGPTAIVPWVRFWTQPDPSVAPPLAYHLAGEVLLQPGPRWQVNLETYYKAHPRLLMLDTQELLHTQTVGSLPQAAFVSEASGQAWGAGVRVAWTGARTSWMMRYTYSQSVRSQPGRFEGAEIAAPWEDPHQVQVRARRELGGGFWAQARGQGIWGRTWGFRRAYYDFLVAHSGTTSYPPYDLSNPEAHRLPAFVRVDLGAGYQRAVGPVTVEFRADFLNALGRDNVLDWSLHQPNAQARVYERAPRLDLPRTPSFSLRLIY
ncbi:MAG: carboxypeptidase-like regulatory domain-containing protein [Bacteroidota bacterium]